MTTSACMLPSSYLCSDVNDDGCSSFGSTILRVVYGIQAASPKDEYITLAEASVQIMDKAYTPGKTDQDVHVRLARLEHIVETALPHFWNQGHSPDTQDIMSERRRSPSPMEDGNRSQAEEEDPCGGMFESGRWFGKSASGSVAAPVVLEQVRCPPASSHKC